MAQKVGITRVSMRKYLDFLKQIDILSMDVLYGNVGRPVYNYRCINPDSQLIKRYLWTSRGWFFYFTLKTKGFINLYKICVVGLFC